MGKGDKKTRRGKIVIKSYGVLRPRKKKKGHGVAATEKVLVPAGLEPVDILETPAPVTEPVPAQEKPVEKKPATKKTTGKKTVSKKTTAAEKKTKTPKSKKKES